LLVTEMGDKRVNGERVAAVYARIIILDRHVTGLALTFMLVGDTAQLQGNNHAKPASRSGTGVRNEGSTNRRCLWIQTPQAADTRSARILNILVRCQSAMLQH